MPVQQPDDNLAAKSPERVRDESELAGRHELAALVRRRELLSDVHAADEVRRAGWARERF